MDNAAQSEQCVPDHTMSFNGLNATPVRFSRTRFNFDTISNASGDIAKFFSNAPLYVLECIVDALMGPLGFMPLAAKRALLVELAYKAKLRRSDHGSLWWDCCSTAEYYKLLGDLEGLVGKYLDSYQATARVSDVSQVIAHDKILDLSSVYVYEPPAIIRTTSEPNLARAIKVRQIENRTVAAARKLNSERVQAAIGCVSPLEDKGGVDLTQVYNALQSAKARRKRRHSFKEEAPLPRVVIPVIVDDDDEPPRSVASTAHSGTGDQRKTFAGVMRAVRRWFSFGKIIAKREVAKQSALAERAEEKVRRWMTSPGDKKSRTEREEIQRRKAAEKQRAKAKSVPKSDRSEHVRNARAAKTAAFTKATFGPDLQSGFLANAVLCAAGAALGKVVGTLRKTDSVLDGTNTLLKSLNGFVDTLKTHFGTTLWVIPLVMICWFFLRSNTNATPLMRLVICGALAALIGKQLWKHVSEFFRAGDVEKQSVLSPLGGLFDVAPKLIAVTFAFTCVRKLRSMFTVSEMLKRIGNLDRISTGFDTLIKWTLSALETCVNFVREKFGKERVKLVRDSKEPLFKWASKVCSITAVVDKGGSLNPEQMDEIVQLIADGHTYRELVRGSPAARQVEEVLLKAVTALQPVAGALNARDNFRVEPCILIMNGKPGVGKTMISMQLCAAVLIESGLVDPKEGPDAILRNLWQKGNSEYWNGYARQLCLVMDDIFQSRVDKTDKENDYMTILRAGTSWAFPLNFADLPSKGRINFFSKFVYGTTNLPSFGSEAMQCLHEPAAVARRITHPYTLLVNSDFQNAAGMLDYPRFEREVSELRRAGKRGMDGFPWHIWSVVKHDFISGSDLGEPRPLRDLVVEIAATLKSRCASHLDAKESVAQFVNGFVDLNVPESSTGITVEKQSLFGADMAKKSAGDLLSKLKHSYNEMVQEHLHWFEVCKNFGQKSPIVATLLAYAGTALAMGVVKMCLGTIWNLLKRFFGYKSKVEKHSNRPPTKPERKRLDFKRAAEPQASDVVGKQSATDVLHTLVYANSYKAWVECEGGRKKPLGQVLFIESDLAVQPHHFMADIRAAIATGELAVSNKVVFRSAVNRQHEFSMTTAKFIALDSHTVTNTEVCFVRYPSVRAHKKITNLFIKESDVRAIMNRDVLLDYCQTFRDGQLTEENVRRSSVASSVGFRDSLYANDGSNLGPVWAYKLLTEAGYCGAPVCALDSKFTASRVCLGIHVAGETNGSRGYAAKVTQEMIEKAIGSLHVIRDNFVQDFENARGISLQSTFDLPFTRSGSFLPIGRVERGVNLAPNTSFYRTALFGRMGVYTDSPAPLKPVMRNGEWVYPMTQALDAFMSPLKIYEQEWLPQAMHVAMIPLFEKSANADKSVYSFEDAAKGIPGRMFRALPRATSAGYPYVHKVKKPGKKDFFGDDVEYDLSGPECEGLRERVEYVVEQARSGVRLSHVFMDSLKDELRSEAKVEAVATRLISCAPLDYTLAVRMLFGAFTSEVMQLHLQHGMAPGVNVYRSGDRMVEVLSAKGGKCFDGDFKGFDASQQPGLLALALEVINRWYSDSEENQLARAVLWEDLVHSRHIGGNGYDQTYIYQWNKSLPSGHPLTTIVNSMYSLMLLVAAYISETGDMEGFWDHVSPLTYGDDNVVNISEVVSHSYNQVTVANALKREFGMTYTSGSKTGEMVPFVALTELTFLKRRFRMERGIWVCPLELNSFIFTHYWNSNKRHELSILKDVLENALQELAMHENDKWAEYAPKIRYCMDYIDHVPRRVPNRDSYLVAVLSRRDCWY